MFCCEIESTLFGLPNDIYIYIYIQVIFTTLFQNSTTQIFKCVAAHFTEDCFLSLGESSLQCEQYEWLWKL